MKNNKYLLKQLTSDIERLQYKIEHRCISNVRSFVARTLIKSGIAIDYALPFIISSVLAYNNLISEGYNPLHFDDVAVKAGIETIDTSSGVHIEHISFDFIYDNRLIEYSTGWIINDNNLYERTVTSYKLNDEFSYHIPSKEYIDICTKGYEDFNFDKIILDKALTDTVDNIPKKLKK